MLKAPLVVGNDIRGLSIDDHTNAMEVLSNAEVIAVNQDALGKQARIVWSDMTEKLAAEGKRGDRLIATKCASGAAGAYEDDPADQKWVLQSDGTIKSATTGLCLNEVLRGESDLGSVHEYLNFTVGIHQVSTADCAQATRWDTGRYVGGSIVSRSSKLCLEVAKFEFLAITQGALRHFK